MTGIDELRRTLDEHAGGRDDQLGARPAAVRHRVRAVRRRRAAAVVVAVVVVLAATTLVVGTDVGRPPVAGTLAGVAAPDTMTSLGYTYRYADGAQGDQSVALDLPESDRPRLVTWATSGSDDTVAVDSPTDEPVSWDGPDFTRWIIVPGGEGGTVTARVASGEVALASYTLTEARPAGVTEHGVTFRDLVAGQTLLAAAVGERGASSVQVPFTTVGAQTAVRYFCSGAPEGAWLTVTFDGEKAGGGSCEQGAAPIDVDAVDLGVPTTPGDRVTATLRVTTSQDGPLLEGDDDLQAGLGLYDDPSSTPPLRGLGGQSFPDVVERDGHLWRLDATTILVTCDDCRAVRALDGLDTPLPTDRGPLLVSVLAHFDPDTDVQVDFGDDHAKVGLDGGGGTMDVVGVDGGTLTIRATGPTDGLEFASAFYVLAD